MPFCRKCGTSIAPDAAFCEGCGTPVSKTKPSLPVVPPPLPPASGDIDRGDVARNISADTKITDTDADAPTMVRNTPSYGSVNLEDLPAGHVIDDRYEVKVKLGQGGFGAVYRAHDRSLGIDKALKVIPTAIGHDFEAMMNLRAETKAMITLNHPAIVRVYDFHESGPIKYIDMEFIEGKSLSQIKAESPERKLPEKLVIDYAKQISEGMAHAHEHNIIHRDLKPQNVLVTNGGRVKVLDFGIAQTLHTSMSRLRNTTSSGTLVYMSPEQIRGLDVGKESDVYSFGAVLYELISGRPPFWQGAIEHQILNEKPALLRCVSEPVAAMIMKCLEKEYTRRPRSFEDVLQGGWVARNGHDTSGSTVDPVRAPVFVGHGRGGGRCPGCGQINHAGAAFCEKCGLRLASGAAASTTPDLTTSVSNVIENVTRTAGGFLKKQGIIGASGGIICKTCGCMNHGKAFCSNCGHDITGNNGLDSSSCVPPSPVSMSAVTFRMKKTSVFLCIVLSFITLGIYWPIWFMTRLKTFNRLNSGIKLEDGVFKFILIFLCISGFITLCGGGAVSAFLNLIVVIPMWVQSFKLRKILMEHYQDDAGRTVPLSGVGTFFFTIYYLQYKINRL